MENIEQFTESRHVQVNLTSLGGIRQQRGVRFHQRYSKSRLYKLPKLSKGSVGML